MTYISVDVDVDLDQFDTEELVEELTNRGYNVFPGSEESNEPRGNQTLDQLELVYQLRRTGRDYQKELDKLFYLAIGKIV